MAKTRIFQPKDCKFVNKIIFHCGVTTVPGPMEIVRGPHYFCALKGGRSYCLGPQKCLEFQVKQSWRKRIKFW